MNQPSVPKFQLKNVQGSHATTEELLADLKRVATESATNIIPQRLYSERGRYDPTTLNRRFGSWNKAVEAAGLTTANVVNYSDIALFENIMRLWEHHGRQPRLAELSLPPSQISHSPYKRRFRSWMGALKEFVSYANTQEVAMPETGEIQVSPKTGRDPSLRLRFRVLKRDNFRCVACGASPAINPGLRLHVDHIIAWSKGGQTVEENLQTLCELCNLGKSNML